MVVSTFAGADCEAIVEAPQRLRPGYRRYDEAGVAPGNPHGPASRLSSEARLPRGAPLLLEPRSGNARVASAELV